MLGLYGRLGVRQSWLARALPASHRPSRRTGTGCERCCALHSATALRHLPLLLDNIVQDMMQELMDPVAW